MDALLPALLGAFPQLGGAGLLLFFVVLLLRREGAEVSRMQEAHATELAAVRADRDAVRERNRALEVALDVERGLRRAAEDTGRHRAPDDPEGGPSPWAG